jgi:hypothetical protein
MLAIETAALPLSYGGVIGKGKGTFLTCGVRG